METSCHKSAAPPLSPAASCELTHGGPGAPSSGVRAATTLARRSSATSCKLARRRARPLQSRR
eukprot:12385723-Alexandrium_andersonii.AAC.1